MKKVNEVITGIRKVVFSKKTLIIGGTALGLAIVAGLVRKNNGEEVEELTEYVETEETETDDNSDKTEEEC